MFTKVEMYESRAKISSVFKILFLNEMYYNINITLYWLLYGIFFTNLSRECNCIFCTENSVTHSFFFYSLHVRDIHYPLGSHSSMLVFFKTHESFVHVLGCKWKLYFHFQRFFSFITYFIQLCNLISSSFDTDSEWDWIISSTSLLFSTKFNSFDKSALASI